jgi:hypothetical protein
MGIHTIPLDLRSRSVKNTGAMTLDQFISALGGTTKTAEKFGVQPSAVSMWRIRGGIPPRLHLRALRIATAHGISGFDPERLETEPQKSNGTSG